MVVFVMKVNYELYASCLGICVFFLYLSGFFRRSCLMCSHVIAVIGVIT